MCQGLEVKRGPRGLPWWSSGYNSMPPMQGGPYSIPDQGTRSHMLQLKILHIEMKIEDPECRN